MGRKTNRSNPLEIGLRARSLPKGVTPRKYFARLLEHMKTGRALPESWEVDILWRNRRTVGGRTRNWQADNFEDAVADSREGFNLLLASILERKLRMAK